MRTAARLDLLVVALLATTATLATSRELSTTDQSSLPRFERYLLLDSIRDSASNTSANVSIGDLDLDGHLDLVLVKGRHWPLETRVMFGDGRGGFHRGASLIDTAYRSYSGRLADLDGDGDLDVVLSNDAPDRKLTFLNDGRGRFRAGSSYGSNRWVTRNAAVADLNGDGRSDIVVANRGRDLEQFICLNRGAGRFDERCTAFARGSATTITPADFDRDGAIDLAVPHRDGGQSYVYLNDGGGSFALDIRLPFGPNDAAIRVSEVADLDADGLLDIVAIDERRGTTIYHGAPEGAFETGLTLSDGKVTPYALTVGDVNGDGRIDVVVGNVEAPSVIFFNDASGRRFTPVRFGDGKGTVYGFALADLDGDRRVDIAVAKSEAPSVVFFADAPRSRKSR
jgi:hypothetical protein